MEYGKPSKERMEELKRYAKYIAEKLNKPTDGRALEVQREWVSKKRTHLKLVK